MVAAAQQLTTALKGNIPAEHETATGLTKLSDLFNQIATAKAAAAAKQLQITNDRRTIKMHPTPTETVPVPRVVVQVPRVVAAIPITKSLDLITIRPRALKQGYNGSSLSMNLSIEVDACSHSVLFCICTVLCQSPIIIRGYNS
jgi:hypothetical protein